MKERPILFSGAMVRALLAGTKTQDRRVIKLPHQNHLGAWEPSMVGGSGCHLRDGTPVPEHACIWHTRTGDTISCQHGMVGDRLWVKHAADVFPVYFKPIAGWEALYAAGTDGVIYRIDSGTPKPLRSSPNNRGYLTVSLSRGKWETHAVHRLICEAFYGPPPSSAAQVRHLDGDRSNNRPQNLDWGTHADNWQGRKGHGGGMGEQHHSAKLSEADVAEILTSPLSQRALSRKFGVSQSTVSCARRGKTWSKHEPGDRNRREFSLWRSPIHMPRWASRILLEITDVRVQRLQDISADDALAEGIEDTDFFVQADRKVAGGAPWLVERLAFADLWESINGAGGWDANPWVWALTFRMLKP